MAWPYPQMESTLCHVEMIACKVALDYVLLQDGLGTIAERHVPFSVYLIKGLTGKEFVLDHVSSMYTMFLFSNWSYVSQTEPHYALMRHSCLVRGVEGIWSGGFNGSSHLSSSLYHCKKLQHYSVGMFEGGRMYSPACY